MDKYSFKVVAELRNDLTESEKDIAAKKIEWLQQKLNIINIGENTYCKAQPFEQYSDFSPMCAFFYELRKIKEYFSRLAYYDLWEGEIRVAV